MGKWILAFAVLMMSFPMWAKFLGHEDGNPFATSKETVDEVEEVTDTMPLPAPELVETPKPLPPAVIVDTKQNAVNGEFVGVWRPPNYANQDKALGYSPGAFAVPVGMEERVQFWMDIYTKYTNDQGVLHDSKYVAVVYEKVDLTDISQNPELTAHQKDKAKEARIKAAKEQVSNRLNNLATITDPSLLQGEELRYWNMFKKYDEPNKFVEASKKGRLRFQAGLREPFMRGISHSGRYLRQMEEIFREHGLPLELTRLPFVESSFNLNARSKVGASGIWQFMRSTGRLYMRISETADERNDPLRSTRAAARKLRQDYEMLQSWPLTVTGWNRGAAGVRRLVEKAQTRDIVELTDMRHGRFGFASANFYASFIAALEVEKNAIQYFGVISTLPEIRGAEVKLKKDLAMAKLLEWFNGDEAIARMYNPHIKPQAWSKDGRLQRRDFFRVPHNIAPRVTQELAGT